MNRSLSPTPSAQALDLAVATGRLLRDVTPLRPCRGQRKRSLVPFGVSLACAAGAALACPSTSWFTATGNLPSSKQALVCGEICPGCEATGTVND